MGANACAECFAGTAAGGALATSLSLDDSARKLSNGPDRLFEMAQRVEEVPCGEDGRNSARGRLPRRGDRARPGLQSEKEFSGRSRKPCAGRRLVSGVPAIPVC